MSSSGSVGAAAAVLPQSNSTEEVVAELLRRSSFVFVSHVKPDGDTLGAGLALGLALKALGKRVGYFQQDPVPRNLRFLPDSQFVSRDVPADLPSDTLWVFCDMSDFSRAGEFLPTIARENMLDVDHHLGNSHFGAFNYVIPTEASTGTCVLRLLRALDVADYARDRNVHPHHHHDGYRGVHAYEHHGCRAAHVGGDGGAWGR